MAKKIRTSPNVNNRYFLWWEDEETKKRIYAGVAYYNDNGNDYTLKVDLLPGRKLFLKAIETNGKQIIYRVEQLVAKRKGKPERYQAGDGESHSEYENAIKMNIGPFKGLVLEGLESLA